jgi:hypothetical protein
MKSKNELLETLQRDFNEVDQVNNQYLYRKTVVSLMALQIDVLLKITDALEELAK